MKNWIKIVLGICIVSSLSFATEESVEDMILRITGSSNANYQAKLETGLAMGTITQENLEEMIQNNAQRSSAESDESASNQTKPVHFGKKGSGKKKFNKKYVFAPIDMHRVSDCFTRLGKLTNNKKFMLIANGYEKFFSKYGKPMLYKNEDGTLSRADTPIAQTNYTTIMMDYSKCLYSLAVVTEKYTKEYSSSESTEVEEEQSEETSALEHELSLDVNDLEVNEEETGAQAVLSSDEESSEDNLEENLTDSVDESNTNEDEPSDVDTSSDESVEQDSVLEAPIRESLIEVFLPANNTNTSSPSTQEGQGASNPMSVDTEMFPGGAISVLNELATDLQPQSQSDLLNATIRRRLAQINNSIITEAQTNISASTNGNSTARVFPGTMFEFVSTQLNTVLTPETSTD
ncbi:DNA polymerase V family protein [bacterium]|nr:DNA polymerase V family protein [bacterium]